MALTAGLGSFLATHSGTVAVTNDLNDFTGPTTVFGATLEFTSIGSLDEPSSLACPTSIADGTIAIAGSNAEGTLRYVGTSPVGHSSDRVIHINGSNSQAIIEASGAGPLTLSGTTTTDSFSTNRSLRLAGDNTGDNTYSGVITATIGSGVQQLYKDGPGKWILTAANTYEGFTSVLEGELALQGASARIGVQDGSVGSLYIYPGATFTLDGGVVEVQDLINNGTFNFRSGQMTLTNSDYNTGAGSFVIGTNGAGTLQLGGGNEVFGNVTLQGTDDILSMGDVGSTYVFTDLDNSAGGIVTSSNQYVQINGGTFTHRVDAGPGLSFASRIQGTGGFTKQGAGTLRFNGTLAHTYAGDTRIEGGTLQVTTSDLPVVPTFVAAGATLDLTNAAGGDEIGLLTGAGTVITPTSDTFAINFTGGVNGFDGSITGSGHLAKRGSGRLWLTGASTYSGNTSVEADGGTLELMAGGSLNGTSQVTIGAKATLRVSGGTLGTTGPVKPLTSSAWLQFEAGLVKAPRIDLTSAGYSAFCWSGGTVHLTQGATINGSMSTALERPFGPSLTLDADMALVIDDTFSVIDTGTFNINGGSVTADNIVTGGYNISFNSGTMRMRNSQTFDTARLNALVQMRRLSWASRSSSMK